MSVKVMGAVWELDLPQPEKFVLLAYADHADHEGYSVRPGASLVAWKTDYSEDSVRRITNSLEHHYGLMELVVRGGGSMANEYRICIEKFDHYQKAPRKRRGRPKNPTQENPRQNKPPLIEGKTPRTAIPPQRHKQPSLNSSKEEDAGASKPNLTKLEGGKEGEARQMARECVATLYHGLKESTVPLTQARKARYGKEFKEAYLAGQGEEVLLEAATRIIRRWEDYQLSVEQAIRDNATRRSGGSRAGRVGDEGDRKEDYEWLFTSSDDPESPEEKWRRYQEEQQEAGGE